MCTTLIAAGAATAQPPSLKLGFSDISSFQSGDLAARAASARNARGVGATIGRVFVRWATVAPTEPPTSEAAADPSWSGYRWDSYDATVSAMASAGLRVEVTMYNVPRWAEGSRRPLVSATAPRGSWKPSLSAYRAFSAALTKRYNGSFPHPTLPGSVLPAVRDWEPWNEPNLSTYLSPQWQRTASGGLKLASPARYRRMNNLFYAVAKAASPSNNVIMAGTAPFGDQNAGEPRVMPLKFLRSLLCVRTKGSALTGLACPVMRFDAANHHPYPIGPPRRRARNADDVVVPDVHKVMDVVNTAVRRGTVWPRRLNMPLWITEISWDSFPDPDGLSLADQAQYLEGALYVLWKQGADYVSWFNLRDEKPVPSFATTYQSGIFQRGATVAQDVAKPSATAFRFPFVAYRSSGVARLWGMAPGGAGPVRIQARVGPTWRTIERLSAASNRIFSGRLRVGRGTALRAVAGSDISLTWTTF